MTVLAQNRTLNHSRTRHAGDVLASRPVRVTPRLRASIVLPAFNEELGIKAVLEGLDPILDESFEVIVVDDGSTDGTALVAEAWGAKVVRHPSNKGKGGALRTGFAVASGTFLVTLDADGTYPAADIPRLLAALESGTDLAIGVRRSATGSMSPLNRLGNAIFRLAISAAAGHRVQDPLSGMYALHRDLVEQMDLESSGFGIETEIVIKAARLGAVISEIDVTYGERIGESKLNPWRDGLVISRTIRRMAARPTRSLTRHAQTTSRN